MRTDVLARLGAIARGDIIPQSGGTSGTGGTLKSVPPQKPASFHAFHLFHLESDKSENANSDGVTAGGTSLRDDAAVAERPAIAIELAPPAYADAWAADETSAAPGQPYGKVLAELRSKCPELVEPDRWQQAVNDAETFLARWSKQAHVLGWTARELFGLHPVPERPAPTFRRLSRYDSTGLIWLLQGRPVIALTDTEAAIQGAGGGVVYRKQPIPNLGPLADQGVV
jgi:hypothetical protein